MNAVLSRNKKTLSVFNRLLYSSLVQSVPVLSSASILERAAVGFDASERDYELGFCCELSGHCLSSFDLSLQQAEDFRDTLEESDARREEV